MSFKLPSYISYISEGEVVILLDFRTGEFYTVTSVAAEILKLFYSDSLSFEYIWENIHSKIPEIGDGSIKKELNHLLFNGILDEIS